MNSTGVVEAPVRERVERMPRPSRWSRERRECAVRMVLDHAGEYQSQRAAIRSVAEKVGGARRNRSGGGASVGA